MKMPVEGIAIFKNQFLRTEEIIEVANKSSTWKEGTAGGKKNPAARVTDIHELETGSELNKELLTVFVAGINDYVKRYPGIQITSGEQLRVARYKPGGHYAAHIDSNKDKRTLSGILYLNDDFRGGELRFPLYDLTITPEPGMLVIFPSNFMFRHEALPVTEGVKYATLSWFF